MPTANNESHEHLASTAKEKLTAPHFDEKAVATAHPVLPLPRRNLSSWRRPALMIAVAVVALVTVVALSAFWIVGSNSPALVDKSNADVQAAPSPETTAPPVLKSPDEGSQVTHVQPKARPQQRDSEMTRTLVLKKQAKPVARRVDVITFSHPRSRVKP